jgi:hypothetical protein
MSYRLNKIPKDFIIVKFLNDIFNKVDLPDELKIYILEIIGIKYCFQNSLIKSYILEKYSDYANNLCNNMNILIDLEYYLINICHLSYSQVNELIVTHSSVCSLTIDENIMDYIAKSDEIDEIFYNHHRENNTLIQKILNQEDKYGLDYIYSILKCVHNETILNFPSIYIDNFLDRHNENLCKYNNIYILPWQINIICLKNEIINFNFRKYRHIRSLLSKSNFKRLFPLFEKIKNDKRGRINIYKILEKKR